MLAERLRARIRREGPIPFRDFMEAALYDPGHGYYARGPEIGGGGDFYTAANVSLFPHAIRRFVDAAVERLGGARVVELGGGTGALAAALGRDVTVVEPSAGLAARQRARGVATVGALADLRPAPTVVLANEVLDALPAHRVVRTADGMRECRVDVASDGAFVEVAGDLSSPEVQAAADAMRDLLPEGAKAEVCLAARALFADLARATTSCVALFLDYGAEREALYGAARPDGTARGFRGHRVAGALEAPGGQDVTVDVDFTWASACAREAGFETLGLVAQGEFLADLGLVDDMMGALSRGDTQAYLAAKGLLLPGGMGERFRALVVGRGVAADPPLPGLRRDAYPGPSRR